MKALCWNGKHDIRLETVPDASILNPGDAVIKVLRTAICGSDLHLYDGFIPTMKAGDILGHEFAGEVVEVGRAVEKLKVGDRVVVPFPISCGRCANCRRELWSLCQNSNPDPRIAQKLYGDSGAALYGYSHMYGGYAGGQAQYVRVPFADVGPLVVPDGMDIEQVLFLSDILPTGYMAAENCDIRPDDIVAVWGCGPVGQFAIRSALLLGAGRVIAIDRYPERLRLAQAAGAEAVNYMEVDDLFEELRWRTGGEGPDSCLDAVGLEAHGNTVGYYYDRIKTAAMLEMDRPNVLRQAIMACRMGGTVSVPGVYGGLLDSVPFGAAFAKGLTMRMGQTHVHRYLKPLLARIQNQEINSTDIISHRLPLREGPAAYRMFRDKADECVKVVMDPWAA
ncbi:MAG TPA: zinc-dependent alcohol dehydrogenase [Terriglobales bacterium]|nr:zinc-dependent alcohol dehydrogenase [Terriglobales bacterium]